MVVAEGPLQDRDGLVHVGEVGGEEPDDWKTKVVECTG